MDETAHVAIDSFSTNTLGLGELKITPEQKPYTALWKNAKGQIEKTALPDVTASGILLHAELLDNKLYYVVTKTNQEEHLNTIHLLAQMGNEELYKADVLMGDKLVVSNNFTIDSMPSGIVQLTLFDNNWIPLQQRIVFINPGKNKTPYTVDGIRSAEPKAKNTIELQMPDTLFTNMSASIADINFYDRKNDVAIQQQLWFNTQLKGLNANITNEIVNGNAQSIDLIMLTHGWRKYNWQKLINKQTETIKPADNYLTLNASFRTNKAVTNSEALTLIITDKASGKQFFSVKPGTDSRFQQDGFVFYDTAKINYQLAKDKEAVSALMLQRIGSMAWSQNITPLQNNVFRNITPSVNDAFDKLTTARTGKFNEMQTIKEVVVKSRYVNPITKRLLEMDDKYATGAFRGIGKGYQMDVAGDPDAWAQSDIYSYIKYKVGGVLTVFGFMGNRNFYPCSMAGTDRCDPLTVFIDEAQLTGPDLETIPLSQIAYVKYIPGIVINSATYTASGALYVYTKKGNEDDPSSPVKMRSINIKGYDVAKEFFNPDYADKTLHASPDIRSTLYWNPYIITGGKNTKATIEYYNNDVSKKLLLTIEGINEQGKLIHIEKIIEQ
jgi:hypothetical protein